MAETADTFSIGMPVEIDQIERELKKLWADGDGAITRASLINLALYSEDPNSLTRNTELIAQITENHACRALVIAAEPDAAKDRAEAWISAHCHMRGSAKQVCSEQISFLLRGRKLLPSILFGHLESDLPLYLWWQPEFRAPPDPQLWAWVDRVIYDSGQWHDFNAQMRLVEIARKEAGERQMILYDLNWTRLLHFRLAFAQFFDHPAAHHHFDTIESASIVFGRGHRSTALLFIGWIAAQLGWELCQANGVATFNNAAGKVRVEMSEEGELPITAFIARSGDLEFRVRRAACRDLLEVSRGKAGRECEHQLLPTDDGELARLISEELMRGGARHVYLRAVEKVRPLL